MGESLRDLFIGEYELSNHCCEQTFKNLKINPEQQCEKLIYNYFFSLQFAEE